MRRIILAAFAMLLLLHAAPSMAAQCRNLALVSNGGVASASSAYSAGWPAATINDGRRGVAPGSGTYWNDGTNNVWPDWAQIAWSSPQTLNRITVRIPLFPVNWAAAHRTLQRARVQYWDGAAWVDVASRAGQPNPILDWVGPTIPNDDGSEFKHFDFTPISTTKIRVLVELGSTDGWSWLEEIEAYGGGCLEPGNQCVDGGLVDGTASASSAHSSGLYPVSGVNNGQRESGTSRGYWNDDTNGSWPDWVEIAWDEPTEIDRVVARIPLARPDFPVGEITLRRTRIQYWDAGGTAWVDVVGRSGQPNPILDWTGPVSAYDGTESRTFDIAPVTTTKIRALIEDGSTDGWSWLDELEAYAAEDCAPATPRDQNLSLAVNGGEAFSSSEYWIDSTRTLNNGTRQGQATPSAHWYDHTGGVYPDWAGIRWENPRTLNRIVVRGPYFVAGNEEEWRRTLGRTRVQYWEAASGWADVTGRSGQDNPIHDWLMPIRDIDGSEVRQFDFAPIATSRVRVLIEAAPGLHSFLEEIEAYWVS